MTPASPRRSLLAALGLAPIAAVAGTSAQPRHRVLRSFDFTPYRLPADAADAELIAIGRDLLGEALPPEIA